MFCFNCWNYVNIGVGSIVNCNLYILFNSMISFLFTIMTAMKKVIIIWSLYILLDLYILFDVL